MPAILGAVCATLLVALVGRAAVVAAPQEGAASEQPNKVDYLEDVLPIIERNCLKCHNAATRKGEFVLDAREDFLKGGESGPVVVPGKATRSKLIAMLQGHAKPKMPPKSRLRPQEIATMKAWIDAGAPFVELAAPAIDERIPAIHATRVPPAPVDAVAFKPDGSQLAIAGYKEIRLVSPAYAQGLASRSEAKGGQTAPNRARAESDASQVLQGPPDLVRGLAYSPDGTSLVAGTGIPGAFGDVLLWDLANGQLRYRMKGHRDYVYDVAFSHDGSRIATCGYDKSIRVWDPSTGRPVSVLLEHTEAVYAVAFSADDQWIASAGGDRAVKLWDVKTAARLYTLGEAEDSVLTVSFHPTKPVLAAAGADKTIRVWRLTAQGGTQIWSTRTGDAPVLRIAYSPDGRWLASAAADRTVKVWDATTGQEVRALETQPEWAQALAWSPDGKTLVVGRRDGTVSLYDATTGDRLADLAVGCKNECASLVGRR